MSKENYKSFLAASVGPRLRIKHKKKVEEKFFLSLPGEDDEDEKEELEEENKLEGNKTQDWRDNFRANTAEKRCFVRRNQIIRSKISIHELNSSYFSST